VKIFCRIMAVVFAALAAFTFALIFVLPDAWAQIYMACTSAFCLFMVAESLEDA